MEFNRYVHEVQATKYAIIICLLIQLDNRMGRHRNGVSPRRTEDLIIFSLVY
jgi:hypothetical protein